MVVMEPIRHMSLPRHDFSKVAPAAPTPAGGVRAHTRCRSCGLHVHAALAHASDADCVEALRVEVELHNAWKAKRRQTDEA
jgi:hypothetical protein